MAISSCLARQLALRGPRAVPLRSATTVRPLSTQRAPLHAPIARVLVQKSASYRSRQFSRLAARHNVAQEAPNPEAYLNSGAIKGARDLIDVKKVLVIGSGGLSIGQAGEFDYSGMSSS
jgi:carbamoyl-phosphate synthase large subunit